jgi:hypothetical protein
MTDWKTCGWREGESVRTPRGRRDCSSYWRRPRTGQGRRSATRMVPQTRAGEAPSRRGNEVMTVGLLGLLAISGLLVWWAADFQPLRRWLTRPRGISVTMGNNNQVGDIGHQRPLKASSDGDVDA